MNGLLIKSKILNLVNVICITGLMIDSGGGLGVRNISFAIIFIIGFFGCYKFKTINKIFLFYYFLFLTSLVSAILVSLLYQDVVITVVLGWIASFLLIPVFFFYINGSRLNNNNFVQSGTIFAILIICLFVGRIYGISFVNTISDYIKDHSSGFFGNKSFLSGDVLPNVYFQGTLSLIICGVLSLKNGNYFSYTVIVIALILAPSRFGFITLILWGLVVFVKNLWTRIFFIPILVMIGGILLYNLPFGVELFAIFNGQSDGVGIRNGHIQSIFDEFSSYPIMFITGEGPGSVFYSKGYSDFVDNIELSQFEYLRKYGIISFVFFTLFYFWPLTAKNHNSFYIKGALGMYYIVSFSNPVLYSIFAMLFLTYAYIKVFNSQQLNQPKQSIVLV